MKKIVILLFCSMFALYANAQFLQNQTKNVGKHHYDKVEAMASKTSPVYRMSGYQTDLDDEFCHFYYDNDNKLIAMLDSMPGEYWYYDSIRYNDLGQLVRIECWQWYHGALTFVNYVDYTYNAQGLKDSRTNYNFINGNWELGGVYTYTYNEAGQIILSELMLGNMLFQTTEYFYRDGLLYEELWNDYDYYLGGLAPYEKLTYTYEDGLMSVVYDSVYNYGWSWSYNGRDEYNYDGNGNCVMFQSYNQYNQVVRKSVYTYNDMLLSQTIAPCGDDIEMSRPALYANHNLYTREQFWTVDIDQVLRYMCDYLYSYDTIGVGIRDVNSAAPLAVYPNPVSSQCVVSLPEGVRNVELFDMTGRMVKQLPVSSNQTLLDLSNLQPGVYMLRAGAALQKVVKQ